MFGGPTLFILGRAAFTFRVSGVVPWRRLVWLLVCPAAAPWAGDWPSMLVAVTSALVLGGVVAFDVLGTRLRLPFLRPGRVG